MYSCISSRVYFMDILQLKEYNKQILFPIKKYLQHFIIPNIYCCYFVFNSILYRCSVIIIIIHFSTPYNLSWCGGKRGKLYIIMSASSFYSIIRSFPFHRAVILSCLLYHLPLPFPLLPFWGRSIIFFYFI